jgi:hypothetical protein
MARGETQSRSEILAGPAPFRQIKTRFLLRGGMGGTASPGEIPMTLPGLYN